MCKVAPMAGAKRVGNESGEISRVLLSLYKWLQF